MGTFLEKCAKVKVSLTSLVTHASQVTLGSSGKETGRERRSRVEILQSKPKWVKRKEELACPSHSPFPRGVAAAELSSGPPNKKCLSMCCDLDRLLCLAVQCNS